MKTSCNADGDHLLDSVINAIRNEPVPAAPDLPLLWNGPNEPIPPTEGVLHRKDFAYRTLKSRRYFAVSASILVIIAVNLYRSRDMVAIAQVQDALNKAGDVAFDMRIMRDGDLIDTRRVFYSPQGMLRAEGASTLHVFNSRTNQFMEVDHASKTAEIRPVYDAQAMQQMLAGSMGRLSSLEPIEQTRELASVQDGRAILQLWVVWDGAVTHVTADAVSKLPLKLVVDRGTDADGKSILEIVDNISFDHPAQAESFAIRPPDGYEVTTEEWKDLDEASTQYVLSVEHGLGPIKWGMSFDQVVALLGRPDSVESRQAMEPEMKDGRPVIIPGKGFNMVPADPPFVHMELNYDSRGFRISVSTISGVTHIHCFDKGAVGLASRRFEGTSIEGISIGMDEREVLAKVAGKTIPGRFHFKNGRLVMMVAAREMFSEEQ